MRTYSTGQGLAAVPELAAKHGLKVLQGVWLSRNRTDNAKEIATAIELAKAYPDTIRGFVVGNEVLLRAICRSRPWPRRSAPSVRP